MSYNKLKITNQQAKNITFKLFGISGVASALPGEIDFNFRIKINNEDGYILKISRPEENEKYLDFQQKLLLYIIRIMELQSLQK